MPPARSGLRHPATRALRDILARTLVRAGAIPRLRSAAAAIARVRMRWTRGVAMGRAARALSARRRAAACFEFDASPWAAPRGRCRVSMAAPARRKAGSRPVDGILRRPAGCRLGCSGPRPASAGSRVCAGAAAGRGGRLGRRGPAHASPGARRPAVDRTHGTRVRGERLFGPAQDGGPAGAPGRHERMHACCAHGEPAEQFIRESFYMV